jgi:hypothetical protein
LTSVHDGGQYDLHANGTVSLYTAVGISLNQSGATRGKVDVSGYTGVTFWAKSDSGASQSVRFNVPTYQTIGVSEYGSCPEATTSQCWDHFGIYTTIGTTWQQ